jgi:hypothetical protein
MKVAGLILLLAASWVRAQEMTPSASGPFNESGKTTVDGRAVPYLIRRLPVDSFPDLPDTVAGVLIERGCMIPQTYGARRPENVVHASLERAGSSDWAVLCAVHGNVDLLVFFARSPDKPVTVASAPELERLQRHDLSGVYGFDWGIDAASPERIHEAQATMEHRPPRLDHDALADTVLNQKTIYHLYAHNAWTLVDMPE